MSTDGFEGCIAKIERARLPLKHLAADINDAAGRPDGYGIRTERDHRTGEMVLYAVNPRTLFVQG